MPKLADLWIEFSARGLEAIVGSTRLVWNELSKVGQAQLNQIVQDRAAKEQIRGLGATIAAQRVAQETAIQHAEQARMLTGMSTMGEMGRRNLREIEEKKRIDQSFASLGATVSAQRIAQEAQVQQAERARMTSGMAAMGDIGRRSLQEIEEKRRISEAFKSLGANSYGAAGALSRFGSTSSTAAGQFRNVAFGIQDIAIMLQAGAGWDRALLGAMNNLGALAMGMGIVGTAAVTAAAVGIPMLVSWFTKADKAAKQLSESLGELRDRYRNIGRIGRELGEVEEDIRMARLPKEERERVERRREAIGRGLGRTVPPAAEREFIEKELAPGLEQELRQTKEFEPLRELNDLRRKRREAIQRAGEEALRRAAGAGRGARALSPEEQREILGVAEGKAARRFSVSAPGEALAKLEAMELEVRRKAGLEGAKVFRDALKGVPEAQRKLFEMAPEVAAKIKPSALEGEYIPPRFVGIEQFSRQIQESITGESTVSVENQMLLELTKIRQAVEGEAGKKPEAAEAVMGQ